MSPRTPCPCGKPRVGIHASCPNLAHGCPSALAEGSARLTHRNLLQCMQVSLAISTQNLGNLIQSARLGTSTAGESKEGIGYPTE